MGTIVADVEADNFLDEAKNIWQLTLAERQPSGVWVYDSYHHETLTAGLKRLQQAEQVVGHNFIAYDVPLIHKLTGVVINTDNVVDTLVLSRLGNPNRPEGHALGSWGQRLGIPKPAHEDFSKWTPEMEHRCLKDVEINVKVFEILEPMLTGMPVACDIEHKVAVSIFKMVQAGAHFDEVKARELLNTLLTEAEEAFAIVDDLLPCVYKPKDKPKSLKKPPNRAHWAHGILDAGVEFQEVKYVKLSVGSREDVVRYLVDKYNWEPTAFTPTGRPKVNDEVLASLPWPEAAPLASYFKIHKTLGYLNGEIRNGKGGGWLHHVTKESKLHAGFIPLTAVTGRPSCVAPNLQQVPTEKRVRQLFTARPGWTLVGVDADGQELRCLGHYLARYDDGAYGREVVEGDIHTRVQEMIGFHTRSGTKPVEYALLYGGGNAKLGMLALKDALSVGETLGHKSLEAVGRRIRKAIMNGLVGFKKLSDNVKDRAKCGRLRGLDGRTLWVRSAHSALNLVLQSSGIIHMKMAIAMMDDALEDVGLIRGTHYELVLWVHDELQFECMPDYADLLGVTAAKCIEDAAVKLGFRVPMTGTYKVGNNWSETH